MMRWIAAAVLFVLACSGAGASEIVWTATLGSALESARETERPVIVDIWAVWCAPCKEMDRTTYVDPEVVAAANDRFVPVKIDADVHESFIERYDIDAYPTLLFLDHEGNEITRMRGLIAAPDLLDRMRPVTAGYADYLAATGRLDDADGLTRAADYLITAENPDGAVKLLRRGARTLKKAPAGDRESVALALGIAQLAADDAKAACKTFGKLDTPETGDATRTAALDWLARCRGDGDAAQRLSGTR